MNRIDAYRKRINLDELRSREALEKDCSQFVNESTEVFEDGKLKIVYALLEKKMPSLVEALKSISYESSYRSGGLPTVSRIFGYSPRSTLRKDFCASTSLSQEFPQEHAAICQGAKVVSEVYQHYNPELFIKHDELSKEKVLLDE